MNQAAGKRCPIALLSFEVRVKGWKSDCDLRAPEVGLKAMESATSHSSPDIREDALEDLRYPLHGIADRIRPYLKVLRDQFQPEKVVVFGSYAHGHPGPDSDIDLLVVKRINQSRIKDKVEIRSAWWPLLLREKPLSFDLMLADPEECERWGDDERSYLGRILRRGVQVL